MKALGMLAIIWGHCFPQEMDSFIYAFNVPLFFWISGYLTHGEPSFGIFFKKCLNSLIIPYFILAFIKCAGFIIKNLDNVQSIYSIGAILSGFHSFDGIEGCGNLWFVYTLILLKITYQLSFNNKTLLITLTFLSIIGTWIYNINGLSWKWAITNTMLAWPFFMMGNLCSNFWKHIFNKLIDRIKEMKVLLKIIIVLCLIFVTYFVGVYNGSAALYKGLYGNSLWLFFIGAITGCLIVLAISVFMDNKKSRCVETISIGTILILVFHRELLHPLLKLINNANVDIITENILMFVSSAIVLLVFIPIIYLVKRFFPIVLGRRG